MLRVTSATWCTVFLLVADLVVGATLAKVLISHGPHGGDSGREGLGVGQQGTFARARIVTVVTENQHLSR